MRHPGPYDAMPVGVHVAGSRPAFLPGSVATLHRHTGMHRMHMHCWAAEQGGYLKAQQQISKTPACAAAPLSFPAAGAAPAR